MSTGNPKPDSPIKIEQKKEIPLSLFIGVGRKDHGMKTVGFSQEFYKLGGEEKIKEMTGFSMEEINAKKLELEEKYQGEKEASKIPFDFKLLDGVLI